MFKRFITMMVISSITATNITLVDAVVDNVNIVNNQQVINHLVTQLASTHEGVYIETVLRGFTKLAEGTQYLLIQGEHGDLGAKSLFEGVAQLIACALQNRNGVEAEQTISQVEKLVHEFRSNLTVLLNTPKQSYKPTTNIFFPKDNSIEAVVIENKPVEKPNVANNEKLLVEGLTQIFYNVFCMLISPNDIGLYLENVFMGFLKVISAILADGKIEREDLENLSSSLNSIFNVRDLQKQLIYKQSLITTNNTANKVAEKSIRDNFEIQEMSTGLTQINQSFIALLSDPKNALTYLKNMCQGLIHLFMSLFADGKVDAHDLNNLVEVIKENETKAMFLLNTPGGCKINQV